MKLKHLQSMLQDVEPFDLNKINVELEQYPTSPELAGEILFIIENQFEDISNKIILDLGCGTGRLTFASFLLGAKTVMGLDIDPNALEIARENAEDLLEEDDSLFFELCDVSDREQVHRVVTENLHRNNLLDESRTRPVDTVIMNPPFGTRRPGIDMEFVEVALTMSNSVYSLHKSSTRSFIEKKAKQLGVNVKVLAELKFDVPAIYKFHKEKSKDIQVDLIRFWH